MMLTFAALAMPPLVEATTLAYAAPIGATLLSALVLRAGRRAALGGGGYRFAGMLLVASPGGGALPLLGVIVALGASLGQSAVMVTRQIGRTEGTAAIGTLTR